MAQDQDRTMWLSWVAFVAGLWLIVSPFILRYSGSTSPTRNDMIVGVIVAVLAFITAVWNRSTASWLSWIIAIVGIWEIAAPFILGYTDSTRALWNSVILGILILIFSLIRGLSFQMPMERRGYGPTFPSEERPKK